MTGSVEYSAPIASMRFAPIEVPNTHPAVQKIVVEADGEQLKVAINLIDVFAEADVNAIAGATLASVIDRLSFELNISVGEPHLTGLTLPKDAGQVLKVL